MTREWKSQDRLAVLIISIVIVSSILIIALVPSAPQENPENIYSYFSPVEIKQTSDGGYIILVKKEAIIVNSESRLEHTGSRIGTVSEGDSILLVKIDLQGNIQWRKTYGWNGRYDARSFVQTSDGGYIILGSLTVEYSENNSPKFYADNICLIKMDSRGNIQWNKTYGGRGWERPDSVLQTSDNGYIVVATTDSYGAGSNDFWLVQTDAHGNMEWNKTYGGSGVDTVTSFQITSDGGYLIAGQSYSDALIIHDRVFLFIKTDQSGTVQWNETYALSESKRLVFAGETSDGEYFLAGTIGTGVLSGTSTPLGYDFWIMKCDANRNILWNKTYDRGQEESLYSVQPAADGEFILAGNTWSYGNDERGIWLVNIDQDGVAEWNKTYGEGGQTFLGSISKTSDEGYIIVGSSSFAKDGVWLVKTDSLGSIEWTKAIEFSG